MNVLDEIIDAKKRQVVIEKLNTPVTSWEKMPAFQQKCISLTASLTHPDKTGVIAEFKRKSPSKGMINDRATVKEVTAAYALYGASGLSILTDNTYFGGSIQDLQDARFNALPILRKDFMIDEYQLIQSKAIGADVILLIAACLTPARVKELSSLARLLGLEVLLEIHSEQELGHICEGIQLVGVNNRDLKTFTVDVQHSVDLAGPIREKLRQITDATALLISESGISDPKTIELLRKAGYSGFLVGEYFMKQQDPAGSFAHFTEELKSARKEKNIQQ